MSLEDPQAWPEGLPDEAFARRILSRLGQLGPPARRFAFVAPLRLVARDGAGARRVDLEPLWERYRLSAHDFEGALLDFARAGRLLDYCTPQEERAAEERAAQERAAAEAAPAAAEASEAPASGEPAPPFELCPLIRTRGWLRAVRAAASDTATLSFPLAEDLCVLLGRELPGHDARPLRREELHGLGRAPRALLAEAVEGLARLEDPEHAGPAHRESCLLLFGRLGWRLVQGVPHVLDPEREGEAEEGGEG